MKTTDIARTTSEIWKTDHDLDTLTMTANKWKKVLNVDSVHENLVMDLNYLFEKTDDIDIEDKFMADYSTPF